MINFKKVQSSAGAGMVAAAVAMAGLGTATISTSAQAVNIAPDGLGEVLVFPYYTVRNGWANYINITNTSQHTVFLKIRWNEGENSRDVRDFNVALSPHDVWTAATLPRYNSNVEVQPGAMMLTSDSSCTKPALTPLNASADESQWSRAQYNLLTTPSKSFSSAAYSGISYDNGSQGMDRTSEGYITIFEMGMIKQDTRGRVTGGFDNVTDVEDYGDITQKEYAQKVVDSIRHSSSPNNTATPDCTFAASQMGKDNIGTLKDVISEPMNVLKGRSVLIHSATGVAAGTDPLTLANFYSPELALGDGAAGLDAGLMFAPGSTSPSLNDADPRAAFFMDADTGLPVQMPAGSEYDAGVDAVSALLSRNSIINDYNVRATSATDWIINFPTKAFYVDADVNDLGGKFFRIPEDQAVAGGYAPFSKQLVGASYFAKKHNGDDKKIGKGKSCVNISTEMWDREEYKPTTPPDEEFSPVPDDVQDPKNSICYETNVLSFGNKSVFYQEDARPGNSDDHAKLYSALFYDHPDSMPGYAGWARLKFEGTDDATSTYNPLPVIGMRVEARKNPNKPLQWHGFASQHAYERDSENRGDFSAPAESNAGD